jgi:uncharacterized protein YkwD
MPLATRARTGQWVTLEAKLLVPVRAARVIVMDDDGPPRAVPSTFDGSMVRARFAPDTPGQTEVQVVADLHDGPRPVLEASVFADVAPPKAFATRPAPGEEAADGLSSDDEKLVGLLDAARGAARLSPLLRDRLLDAIARSHAERMAREGRLAHDAGDGDPTDRLREAGIAAEEVAENVAHAPTVLLAHRAQWWSPAHRMNLLCPAGARFGIGTARDERGEAWVVAEFAR